MEQGSGIENSIEKEHAKKVQVPNMHLLANVSLTLNWKVPSPTALAHSHLCSYINVQEEETASGTMEVEMHDYNHPHSGRHPGIAERNDRFRPVGVHLGGDDKAVETSDLTGLLTDELEVCVP